MTSVQRWIYYPNKNYFTVYYLSSFIAFSSVLYYLNEDFFAKSFIPLLKTCMLLKHSVVIQFCVCNSRVFFRMGKRIIYFNFNEFPVILLAMKCFHLAVINKQILFCNLWILLYFVLSGFRTRLAREKL